MAEIHKERMTVKIEGDFVVFLIGMRINKPWKLHKWLPVGQRKTARERLNRELDQAT